MKCPICEIEFEPKRKDAKSCGKPACRKALQRVGASVSAASTPTEEPAEEKQPTSEAQHKFPGDPERQKILDDWDVKRPSTTWLKTNTPLDELTMIPEFKITILYGRYGVGKTTLSHLIAANSGKKTLYIDTEAALDNVRLASLKIRTSTFDVVNLTFIEDVVELLQKEETLKKYDLIIWDSVANTTFVPEVEGAAGDFNIGTKARIMNKAMRILPNLLNDNKCTLLLINQERDGIGLYAENYIPAGKGQLYSASLIIRLTGRYPKVKAEVTKSRVSANGKLEFTLTP